LLFYIPHRPQIPAGHLFAQYVIPFWNVYLLARQVLPEPGLYAGALAIMAFVNHEAETACHPLWVALYFAQGVMHARLFGLVAAALGKSFWLHAVLAFFGFRCL